MNFVRSVNLSCLCLKLTADSHLIVILHLCYCCCCYCYSSLMDVLWTFVRWCFSLSFGILLVDFWTKPKSIVYFDKNKQRKAEKTLLKIFQYRPGHELQINSYTMPIFLWSSRQGNESWRSIVPVHEAVHSWTLFLIDVVFLNNDNHRESLCNKNSSSINQSIYLSVWQRKKISFQFYRRIDQRAAVKLANSEEQDWQTDKLMMITVTDRSTNRTNASIDDFDFFYLKTIDFLIQLISIRYTLLLSSWRNILCDENSLITFSRILLIYRTCSRSFFLSWWVLIDCPVWKTKRWRKKMTRAHPLCLHLITLVIVVTSLISW